MTLATAHFWYEMACEFTVVCLVLGRATYGRRYAPRAKIFNGR